VQRIILCPKCHVQVKKDNLGELLCPNCDARLCPKAHIFDGKICPYCGWEDPNYHLWKERQKARSQRPASKKLDESPQAKLRYTCPKCGTSVNTAHKDCPSCGLLGAKYRAASAAPTGIAPTAARPVAPAAPFIDKVPSLPPKKGGISPTRSPLLREIAKAERREWNFPPLRRFVRPVLASLLVGTVLSGLILGGINVTRFVSQSAEPGNQPPILPPTPAKTYALSTNVAPEGKGNSIDVEPPSDTGTYPEGIRVELTATPDPNGCYTFSYWDGASGSSETINIVMDSNKSVTAHFKLKDTTPPAISEVRVPKVSDIGTTITWKTDEPTTYQIYYGKTQDCDLPGPSSKEFADSHSARLSALEANTTYYFKVKSQDKCGNVNPQPTSTKTFKTLSDIPVGYEVGKRTLDFTLPYYHDDNPESPNKEGKIETLSNYIGKKKIMLNFWNTFCGACIGESPGIRAIYEDTKLANKNSEDSDLVVFTVCIDGRADRIEKLEAKYFDTEDKHFGKVGRFTFPILLDMDDKTSKDYHVWTVPKTVFIDSDGIIREIKIGRFTSKEEVENILKSLD